MPLHQQLFLAGHEPAGKLRVHVARMRLGLAAALLAELVVAEHLQVSGDRIWVLADSGASHPDPLAETARVALRQEGSARTVSAWLRATSESIYDRVAGGLVAAGLVLPERRRREIRYPQTDARSADARVIELRTAVVGTQTSFPPAIPALAGLFSLLRLEETLGINAAPAEILHRLAQVHSFASGGVQDVVAVARAVAEEIALSAYR